MSSLVAIDLFSGAGGLSKGLDLAGFSVIAGIENDWLSIETYKLNLSKTELFNTDIRLLPPSDIASKLDIAPGELDLLAGCPPCQSFSALRTRNGSINNNDPSKELIAVFTEYVDFFYPKTVLLENVPGISKSKQFVRFCRSLSRLGYHYTYDILDACNYSVPQRRKRLVFIASRSSPPKIAPRDDHTFSVNDALSSLDVQKLSSDPLHNYQQHRSERIRRLIKAIPKDGGSRKELPDEMKLNCHKLTMGYTDVYGRMSWNNPAPTITGGCINPSRGRFLHPSEDRAITLREAATLQGFPQDYQFSLAKGYHSTAQMIGNAFPPPFAFAIAKHLKQSLF
ncbi:MAG: DNA cytosine methyltransferase [Candidatus Thiodiazotropha lotti]|nr:DNA cytosine methyltransferase [Candidatus Thiodiazotropha lotti]